MNIALITIASLRNSKESARITTINLAKQLKKNGHNVCIITEKVNDLPIIERANGINIYRYYKIPFLSKILSYPLALYKLKKQNKKFEIIHGFSATPLFALTIVLCKLIYPKAKTIHTIKSYPRGRCKSGYFLLNFVNKITFPTLKHAKKSPQLKNNKKNIIRSPINMSKFFCQEKINLKKKYGYENNKIILYYGAMWENKGINILIKSIPTLKEKFSNIKLICAPRYKNIEKQKELVKILNIKRYVEFHTNNIKIEDYVSLSDVVVLPYLSLIGTEGNPSCLLESMACKTPVVTTDLPELKEIAEDCVIMAKPGDVKSLAEKIDYALNNDLTEMIENAYKKSKEFDVEIISKQFLELYKS